MKRILDGRKVRRIVQGARGHQNVGTEERMSRKFKGKNSVGIVEWAWTSRLNS